MPLLVCAFVVSACARSPIVERAYDGRVVDGRFIPPQSYAAFLRAASAGERGDLKGALVAYMEALRIDPRAPEIWTRIGDVRCRLDPRDLEADECFARALSLDKAFAPVWSAKAGCALARNDMAGAWAAAVRAAALDPRADTANALLARGSAPYRRDETRSLLVALTLTAREPVVAWDAVATWAKSNDDATLMAWSLAQLARIAPGRREEVASAAEDLAGQGEQWLAQGVAAAVADADDRPLGGDHALAARLAVDEAVAHGAVSAVSSRATRVRLPLDEAAGRALLRGHRSLAMELASPTARGDPTAVGARMVVAAGEGAKGTDVLGTARDANGAGQAAASAAFVAFGGALARATSPGACRTALAAIGHGSLIEGDDLVVRPAVDLVLRGALDAEVLPAGGMVELLARRGIPAERMVMPAGRPPDLRHEYLWLALTDPECDRAKNLSAHFADRTVDPFVTAASALMKGAVGGPTASAAGQKLLSRDAGDPLIAAIAWRIAQRVGDVELARRASLSLTALGETLPMDVK